MGVRFSKSIKIGKYFRINISKSGISATVGKKGASVNIGGNGVYVNASPSAVGISGTGLSYRQKITGGYKDLLGKFFKSDKDDETDTAAENTAVTAGADLSEIEEFEKNMMANTYPYHFIDNVMDKKTFDGKISDAKSEAARMVYQLSIDGDEDTIESMVGSFLSSVHLDYDVKASYELDGHDLYVDLDLPEIEDFSMEYPAESKGKVVMKKKTQTAMKQQYAQTVCGLGVYLAACFFNTSSYIDKIILSGFTTRRNSKGELQDDYIYSVKYTRDIFEKTDLKSVEDAYEFMLKFENRVNYVSNTLKAIEPYDMILEDTPSVPSVEAEGVNPMIIDAINGLVELGYNAADVEDLIPELGKLNLSSSGEYLKAALKMMA
ncbi:MAG: DUF4236 domain-containing protein [Erysipelotrichaceae bacterium]|nr:DUF4236 domain-containing protein [Erysipelotrichaceae bacterium]